MILEFVVKVVEPGRMKSMSDTSPRFWLGYQNAMRFPGRFYWYSCRLLWTNSNEDQIKPKLVVFNGFSQTLVAKLRFLGLESGLGMNCGKLMVPAASGLV